MGRGMLLAVIAFAAPFHLVWPAMTKKLGWGIISTGRIAGIFAQGLARAENGRLVAVGSRTLASAQKFAAANGNPRAHGSYEALLG